MAEIKIEKKQPIWPWVLLGLIILAAVLYFFVFKNQNSSQLLGEDADTTAIVMDNQNEGAVAEYINFIDGEADTMTLAHDYSHEALSKLADATKAMSNKTGVDVSANLNEVKALSQQITNNPMATTHADDIRKASTIIATALGTIQQTKFPDLRMNSEDLMNDAKAVDENDLTLRQKSTVRTFFNSAANLLQKMNSNY
nr:hypothetical protein [Pseudopedobacter sp.]